jgi:hypothetical protein
MPILMPMKHKQGIWHILQWVHLHYATSTTTNAKKNSMPMF